MFPIIYINYDYDHLSFCDFYILYAGSFCFDFFCYCMIFCICICYLLLLTIFRLVNDL